MSNGVDSFLNAMAVTEAFHTYFSFSPTVSIISLDHSPFKDKLGHRTCFGQ